MGGGFLASQSLEEKQFYSEAINYYDRAAELVYSKPDSAILYTCLAADCYLEAGYIELYYSYLLALVNMEYVQKRYSSYKIYMDWYMNLVNKDTINKNKILPLILNSKAVYFYSTGQTIQAQKELIRAINLLDKNTTVPSDFALYHSNLSSIYYRLNDYRRSKVELEIAFDYLDKSMQTKDSIFGNRMFPETYFELGRLYYRLKNYDQADMNIEKSFELLEQRNMRNKRIELINIYISMNLKDERYAIGSEYFDDLHLSDCISSSDSILYFDNLIRLSIWENAGVGELDFDKIEKIIAKIPDDKRSHYHMIKYLSLRIIYLQDLDYIPQEILNEFYNLSEEVLKVTFKENNVHKLDFLLSKIKFNLSKYCTILEVDRALLFKLVLEISNQMQSTESRIILNSKLRDFQIFALSICDNIENQFYLFDFLELNKSSILLDDIFVSNLEKDFFSSEILSNQLEQRSFINFLNEEIYITEKNNSIIGGISDSIQINNLKEELSKATNEYDLLRYKIDSLYPEYSNFVLNQKIYTTQEIQATLAPNELLLETVTTDSSCHLFFISNDQIEHKKINGNELLTLKQSIDNYSNNISQGNKTQSEIKTISQIFNDTDLSFLENKNRLIVVPDGFLYKLPFELLEINDKQLFQTHSISYQYSYKLYLVLKEQGKNRKYNKDFVGVSFPVNETIASAERVCDDLEVSMLACTKKEVESIENILGFKNKQSDLSTEEFIKQSEGAKIIHIASHACPDEENHQLSRIHFKDDYLTNYDISVMNLDADIAVLSACETGSGKILDGEGAMTIAKAFFQAGVHTNIVSLWKVDDCSTAKLMSYFYEHLYAGEASDIALQNAKKDFLQNSHPQYHDPYYWAGFIHMGDTDAVFTRNSSNKALYLALTGILIFLLSIYGLKAIKKAA